MLKKKYIYVYILVQSLRSHLEFSMVFQRPEHAELYFTHGRNISGLRFSNKPENLDVRHPQSKVPAREFLVRTSTS